MSLVEIAAREVRAEMGRRQTTRAQLADILGLSGTQTGKRLGGAIEFRLSELEKIAVALGMTVEITFRAVP